MTNNEAIGFLQSRVDLIDKCYPDVKDYREALVVAIEALEKEPCEDCISRGEAEAIFKNARKSLYELSRKEQIKDFQTRETMLLNAEQFIHLLPPVTPQQKVGRWLHPYKSDIACECSECHMQMAIANYFNYCPNCGAKMEVEE